MGIYVLEDYVKFVFFSWIVQNIFLDKSVEFYFIY